MSLASLDPLPDHARVWCFAADRPLDAERARRLADAMSEFLAGWTAHRRELRAGLELRCGRFLLVAVDESRAGASGCSIDSLVRRVSELEAELGIRLTDSAPVWFRDSDGAIRTAGRAEFRELAASGRVGADTVVFDTTLARLGELRSGRFEVPAARSWHSRLLGAAGEAARDGAAAERG